MKRVRVDLAALITDDVIDQVFGSDERMHLEMFRSRNAGGTQFVEVDLPDEVIMIDEIDDADLIDDDEMSQA